MAGTWFFFRDIVGQWQWEEHDAGDLIVQAAAGSFARPSDCLTDAARNGYRPHLDKASLVGVNYPVRSASIILAGVAGRMGLGSRRCLSFEFSCARALAPVTLDVHLEDRCMVNQPIHGSEGHGRVWEDALPG